MSVGVLRPERTRLEGVRERLSAVLAAGPGPDLRAVNGLADEMGELRSRLSEVLAGGSVAEAMDAAGCLADLTAMTNQLREHVTAIRYATLERIHEGLARLRGFTSVAELIPEAADELAHCCDFDRALVSAVRGSSWRAEAVWIRPDHDPDLARRVEEHVTEDWLPFGSGVLEAELVRRRVPILVRESPQRPANELMTIADSPAFVAAPIVANQRVIGFFLADCVRGGRPLTTIDRDNIASFAEGFGLVFERNDVLERLDRQRARVVEAFSATERELAGLTDAETVLVRRDRESVAVVRMAAGLRKISVSPVDQLLTVRERQVIELMVEGARNRQIAEQLVISEETVKSHVRSVSRKLRATSRAEAVSRYLQLRMREGA